jgi:hypothetical protein
VSSNSGKTWTGSDALQNSINVLGDPSTAYDYNGNVYLSTITNLDDGYFLQRSVNNGNTWSNLIRGVTVNNFDKEMIAIDDNPGSPHVNNIYCTWSEFNAPITVNFNKSTDSGQNFSIPITIKTGYGQGANVQTGVNGEVYVCWADFGTGNFPANGIGFTVSNDGGNTFSNAKVAFPYSGISSTNNGDPTFNNIRINDFPSMSVDKSNSVYKGRIYITYPTKENGNGKAIIQVRYSDDKGATWSSAKTVSISNGRQSWFPWISVDPITGIVSIIYYSFDSSTGFSTNTYVAYSIDGSSTFTNIKVSDVPHTTEPINNNIFAPGYSGDYIGIASYGGVAYPAWMDNRNGTWQVYVSKINYLSIDGSSQICNQANTYTVNNLPPGITPSWSVNIPNIISFPSTGNPISVTKTGAGIVTLTATINSSTNITKAISVGAPYSLAISSYSNLDVSNYINGAVKILPSGGYYAYEGVLTLSDDAGLATNYQWSLPPNTPNSTTCSWWPNGNSVDVATKSSSTSITLMCTASNNCGYFRTYVYFHTNDVEPMIITPNPSSTQAEVSLLGTATQASTAESPTTSLYSVTVVDSYGFTVYSGTKKEKKFNLQTSAFRNGIYIVLVSDGKNTYQNKLVVKH